MATPSARKLTPRQFAGNLSKRVIGQGWVVRALAIALVYPELIRVMLIGGKRGRGKTFSVEMAAAEAGRLVLFADGTQLTQQGYVGDDVEDLLLRVWKLAKGDREKAETAIIVIDEFDKMRKNTPHRGPDVNGAGAQQTLLTAIQGTTLYIGKDRDIPFDTRRITWVLLGAFEGADLGDDPNWISDKALIDWGMIPQLVDRIPVRVQVGPLSRDEFRRIARLPHMPLAQLEQKFRAAGIELVVPDATVEVLLDQLDDDESVRGLKSVFIRNLTLPFLNELPEWAAEGVTRVEVPPGVVLDRAPPIVIIPPPPPPPPPEPPPELAAARLAISYEFAPDDAQEYWRKVERENPPDVLRRVADRVGRKYDLQYFHIHTRDCPKKDLVERLHHFERVHAEDEEERERRHHLAFQTIFKTGEACPVDGTYVFHRYVQQSCSDPIEKAEVSIELSSGKPFPVIGTRKQPAYWRLVRVAYGAL